MSLLLLLRAFGASYAIVGAVTVTTTPAAALDFTRHANINGGVTVAATPSATMDITRHHAIGGQSSIALTPNAAFAYARHFAVVGASSVSATPAAALDFTRHAALVGTAAVSATPAATLDYQRHASLGGAVAVTAVPSATLDHQRHAGILGAIEVSSIAAAALDYTRHAAIGGSVATAIVPAAAMEYSPADAPSSYGIIGGVTVAAIPAAALAYLGAPAPPTHLYADDRRTTVDLAADLTTLTTDDAMANTIFRKAGDDLEITGTLDGGGLDAAAWVGATATLNIAAAQRIRGGGVTIFEKDAIVRDHVAITLDTVTREFSYAGPPLEYVGVYNFEVEVTLAGGAKRTFPNDGHKRLVIRPELA
ncbi:MAG: hypothetical protein WD825_17275 [Gemmatimonadaceae bacterium]